MLMYSLFYLFKLKAKTNDGGKLYTPVTKNWYEMLDRKPLFLYTLIVM